MVLEGQQTGVFTKKLVSAAPLVSMKSFVNAMASFRLESDLGRL